jgi:glycosyltransferase involved in cell wall biosynthesis
VNFLLLNQFYPPDAAPTGWYLHGLARELVRRGHSAKVFCSRRSYDGRDCFPRREKLDGVEVSRLPATGFGRRGFAGKLADYCSFYLSLAGALLLDRSKPDLILSLTTPPYIGLLGKAAAGKFGCRHAHWIMDLYPDVMFAHKMTPDDGLVFRFLQKLTRFQLRGAEAVISLGPCMTEKVAAYDEEQESEVRGQRSEVRSQRSAISGQRLEAGSLTSDLCPLTSSPSSRRTWIPLWSDPELAPWPANEMNPLRSERGWADQDVVFLYSGNMGLGHRFAEFLEAARQLGASGPRWVFSGGGRRRREIETFATSHPAARIEFLDYVPRNRLRSHLCAADVHLASLDSAWQGLIVPSKIQASFAVARPVLFVGGDDCETAAWIQESGGGWVVGEDDLGGLLKAVEQAVNLDERQRRGQAAFAFARTHFQISENCAHIAQILEGKADERSEVRDQRSEVRGQRSEVGKICKLSQPRI